MAVGWSDAFHCLGVYKTAETCSQHSYQTRGRTEV